MDRSFARSPVVVSRGRGLLRHVDPSRIAQAGGGACRRHEGSQEEGGESQTVERGEHASLGVKGLEERGRCARVQWT